MHIKCPHCQKVLQIDDSSRGQNVKCPLCQRAFAVPQQTAAISKMTRVPLEEVKKVLELIESYQRDIEKSIQERGEAMEMVDGFFQLFLDRAGNPDLSPEEQQENQDIANKLFQLQKKFPLLSGFKDVLSSCDKIIRAGLLQ